MTGNPTQDFLKYKPQLPTAHVRNLFLVPRQNIPDISFYPLSGPDHEGAMWWAAWEEQGSWKYGLFKKPVLTLSLPLETLRKKNKRCLVRWEKWVNARLYTFSFFFFFFLTIKKKKNLFPKQEKLWAWCKILNTKKMSSRVLVWSPVKALSSSHLCRG